MYRRRACAFYRQVGRQLASNGASSWLDPGPITCVVAGGYSSAYVDVENEFHVSAEVATVGLSMYILGFAIGPPVLAPLSEYFGRSPVYVVSWLLLVIFDMVTKPGL